MPDLEKIEDFRRFILTNKGSVLINKLHTGTVLEVTRVSVGDGQIEIFEDVEDTFAEIREMQDLKHYLCDAKVVSNKNNSNGSSTLKAILSSTDLESSISVAEVGVFAYDPDEEKEILYSYGFTQVPKYLPQFREYEVAKLEWDLTTEIGEADNIKVEIKKVEVDYDEFFNYLENMKMNWEAQMEAINKNFDTMNYMFNALNNQYMNQFKEDIDRINASIEIINGNISDVTSQITAITGNISQLQLEVANKADKNHTHESESVVNSAEFIQLKSDFTDFKNEYTTLQKDLKDMEMERERILVEIAFLRGDVPAGYENNMLIENFVDINVIKLDSGFYDDATQTIYI